MEGTVPECEEGMDAEDGCQKEKVVRIADWSFVSKEDKPGAFLFEETKNVLGDPYDSFVKTSTLVTKTATATKHWCKYDEETHSKARNCNDNNYLHQSLNIITCIRESLTDKESHLSVQTV